MIGAGPPAIAGKQRVQRIEPEDRGAALSGLPREIGECGEVADALIAGAAQRVEMRGHAEAALPGFQRGRQIAASQRHDQMAQ